jgi:orotidine-5'-phosphate decarboxylase
MSVQAQGEDGGSFGDRVGQAVRRLGSACAGIDPSAELLRAWDLNDDVEGLRTFGAICVEAFAGTVAVIKPQVAFFERHGSAGLAALERLIVDAHEAGLLVLCDAKRGDIDSTAAAYADAWLGDGSPLAGDAVTVHPYLGLAALAPCIELAGKTGRGVIVVTRSSNPEGRALQQAVTADGTSVEDTLLREIAQWNGGPGVPEGTVGAVIGATLMPSAFPLSQLRGVIVAPGVGAQGATPVDVKERFEGCPAGSVLVSTSRSLLSRGPGVASLRQAAVTLQEELAPLTA